MTRYAVPAAAVDIAVQPLSSLRGTLRRPLRMRRMHRRQHSAHTYAQYGRVGSSQHLLEMA